MKKYFIAICTFILVVGASNRSNAQCNNSLQFSNSKAAPMGMDGKPDMSKAVSGDKIFPEYYYEIQYEKSIIKYKITEFKFNQQKIYLYTWCMGQTWDQPSPSLMSQMSRTLSFKPVAGEEVSFFREMWWYDQNSTVLNADIYSAGHDISYKIVLVDSRSHQQLAVLDAIEIARQDQPGVPKITATHPVIDVVKYTIPKNITVDSAYLRVDISMTEGIDNYKLLRFDTKSINLSARDMNEPNWLTYAAAVEKHNTISNSVGTPEKLIILKLPVETPLNTTLRIAIDPTQVSDAASVRVVNSSTGNIVFSQEIFNSKEMTLKLERAGAYIVSVVENGQVLESHNLLVTK